jgi:hypothetical protein
MLGQLQEVPNIGYVYLAVVYTVLMNFYLSHNVMKARKKFDVKYPTMYSSDDRFNCYQVSFPVYSILTNFTCSALTRTPSSISLT